MKMYCISSDIETAVGLKLTGIDSVVLQDKKDIEDEIDYVLQDENIGILIVTDIIYESAKEKFDEIKDQLKLPLLVKI